jgi:PAS domain S-box-containing protein
MRASFARRGEGGGEIVTDTKRVEGNSTLTLYARLEASADEHLNALLALVAESAGADSATLVMLDEKRAGFGRVAIHGSLDGPFARPLVMCAFAMCSPADEGLFVVDDVRANAALAAIPELRADRAPRSFAAVRVRDRDGASAGVLALLSAEPGRFGASARRLLVTSGRVAEGHLATQEDVARLRARHARQLEELVGLRGLVGATAMLPTLRTDLDGIIRSMNASAERCFKVQAADVVGKEPLTAFATDRGGANFSDLLGAARSGGVDERDFTYRRRDGTTFVAQVDASAICDEDGEEVGYAFLIQDVTDRRRAEAALVRHRDELSMTNRELSRLVRLKDAFIAGMSHELRTPMNAMLGFAEALDVGVYGSLDEAQQKAIAEIRSSGEKLRALSDDVIDLFKAESQRLELDIKPIPVAATCRAALNAVQSGAQKKHLAIALRLDGELGTVDADERRLVQILVSLLRAAAGAAAAGGSLGLTVSPHPDEEAVRFTIWDTGPGLSAEARERFFEAFKPVDASGASHAGVSLALARRLIELHRGEVTIESEAGSGMELTVTLPLRYERVSLTTGQWRRPFGSSP